MRLRGCWDSSWKQEHKHVRPLCVGTSAFLLRPSEEGLTACSPVREVGAISGPTMMYYGHAHLWSTFPSQSAFSKFYLNIPTSRIPTGRAGTIIFIDLWGKWSPMRLAHSQNRIEQNSKRIEKTGLTHALCTKGLLCSRHVTVPYLLSSLVCKMVLVMALPS